VAGLGTRRSGTRPRSNARSRGTGQLEAPLSATSGERQRARDGLHPDRRCDGIPDQIALLLPLSGRAEPVGVAVRDGFIAAYLEQAPATRPRLKIYDVAAESVGSAYTQAITEGAGFVVGPLTKEDVAAVVPLSDGRTPVLALNFLGESVSPPHNFYQFSLLPRMRRAWSRGA